MKVFDVIRVKKPGHYSSYPTGSVIVGTFNDEATARRYAANYNEHRYTQYDDGFYYTTEEIDEEDPNRRPGSVDVREDGTIKNPAAYGGRRTLGEWPPDPPR